MLFRFCLYGFLKNLRFFDAFLLLALRERGLDYFAIGSLVSVRELTVLALEVPSGAIADTFGRRRCMVASMLGYIAAGVLLYRTEDFAVGAAAMLCYGIGDAFRSGTHKALILAWLRQQGRLDEKTRFYGVTRSWSQLGSACSALLGGGLLAAGGGYGAMFLASVASAAINLVNLATYPRSLDERRPRERGAIAATWRRLVDSLRDVLTRRDLRPVLLVGVVARGSYAIAKDYLQPVLLGLATAMATTGARTETALGVLVGVVSAATFVLGSIAARKAHRYEAFYGDAERCARALTRQLAASYLLLGVSLLLGLPWLAVLPFALLTIGNNLWRPVQVGRLGALEGGAGTATVLSIEAQASSVFAAAVAPAVGAAVDHLAAHTQPPPPAALAPLALLALPLMLVRRTK